MGKFLPFLRTEKAATFLKKVKLLSILDRRRLSLEKRFFGRWRKSPYFLD